MFPHLWGPRRGSCVSGGCASRRTCSTQRRASQGYAAPHRIQRGAIRAPDVRRRPIERERAHIGLSLIHI
eukprot:8355621-Pyramimonas_sp.AAC.1